MKKIGIVGGAGPMASCLLYKLIIENCQKIFGCKQDSDFPEIVFINYPFSPMLYVDQSEKNKKQIISELQYSVDKLSGYGVDMFVIACNTLHTFVSDLDFRGMSFVSMVQTLIEYTRDKKIKNLFILGTPTTIGSGIYSKYDIDIFVAAREHQGRVDQVIDRILAGDIRQKDFEEMVGIIDSVNKLMNFDAAVLSCTDLSILYDLYRTNSGKLEKNGVLILDPLELVVERLVKEVFA
jgi:aspartate racemase